MRPAATCCTTRPGRSTRRSCAKTSRSSAFRSPRCASRLSGESRERMLHEEHRVRRRARGAAEHRHGRRRPDAGGEVREEAALLDSNHNAIRLGYDYAQRHFECPLPFRLERMDATSDSILIDGNTAAALGCRLRGRDRAAWYPITPSTSVMDAFKRALREVPHGARAPGKNEVLHPSGRGRARGRGHGHRCRLDRRALLHVHRRARHLADERVRRARVLHRDPGRHLRHPAHGPVHRHADAHAAGGPPLAARTRRTATPSTSCCSRANPEECFYLERHRRSISPSASRRRCSSLTDLDIGMNDWMCKRLQWDDSYRARSRQGAGPTSSSRRSTKFSRYSPRGR